MAEYSNAFADLWDNVLTAIPNDIDHISETLERELILRRFNRHALSMETSTGSTINQVIGVGYRTDETGKTDVVSEFYPSYFRNMVHAFAEYPITKHFGITIKDAMALPMDQWLRIRKAASLIPEQKPNDDNAQLFELLKELIVSRNGTE